MPPQRRIGILSQLVPPKATWTAESVPDQTGKVAIVTYGHFGVGKETARVRIPLPMGARYVLLADRRLS